MIIVSLFTHFHISPYPAHPHTHISNSEGGNTRILTIPRRLVWLYSLINVDLQPTGEYAFEHPDNMVIVKAIGTIAR